MPTESPQALPAATLAPNAPIGVGLLGCGTVGTGVARLLLDEAHAYAHRVGRPIELVRIGVRHPARDRGLPAELFTDDLAAVVADPRVHIVVEALGGVEPALPLLMEAIARGKHVVTANKEVIARHGHTIFPAARARGVAVHIEATVAGGIPIVAAMKSNLAANRIQQVAGIINGTTNYILTAMTQQGHSLEAALAEAQRLGYAEADPTADVEAYDAAYKIAILASIFFDHRVAIEEVHREGILNLTAADIAYARELGYVVKLLGVARRDPGPNGEVLQVRVHPALIPAQHPLAPIDGVMNAVAVRGAAVGEVMFSGPGAGMFPTASAILGDVLAIAAHPERPDRLMTCLHDGLGHVSPVADLYTQFYVRLLAQDQPGVIGTIGTACGRHGISIRSMVQKGERDGCAEIVLVTHRVQEAAMRRALEEMAAHPSVHRIGSVIRVEDLAA
ncbi:MAG: homoserine dehydrogenase [Candidatus Sericytochromatia bacterium]|nr:homoserine dehydrogenase [Candidatus Sericytochromatia bacterium]